MKEIEVVAAIIEKDDTILCVQRGDSKYSYVSHKWEFAGGKVEKGESHEQALIREIQEELSLTISVDDLCTTVKHSYPDFSIIMHCYFCRIIGGDMVLHEHVDSWWLSREELGGLDWAAADVGVVERLVGVW